MKTLITGILSALLTFLIVCAVAVGAGLAAYVIGADPLYWGKIGGVFMASAIVGFCAVWLANIIGLERAAKGLTKHPSRKKAGFAGKETLFAVGILAACVFAVVSLYVG